MARRKRDSAAIARKARITKARKVLKAWADGRIHLELLTPGVGLRIRGTIRQLGDEPESDEFLFVSNSREVTSTIDLGLWKGIAVERRPWISVHLNFEVSGGRGLTLVEEYVADSRASEISSLLEQLRLWARLQTRLISSFEFSFASSYWPGTLHEHAPGVFALVNKEAGQMHLINTAQCGSIEMERTNERTDRDVDIQDRTLPVRHL